MGSGAAPALEDPEDSGPRAESSFRLEISLAVGYQHKRARLVSQFEANVTSLLLMLGGVALLLLVVYGVLWRLGLFQGGN